MYCTNEILKESWSYARKGNLATILYSSLGKHRYVFLLFRLELKIYLNSNHNEKYLFRAFVKIRKKYQNDVKNETNSCFIYNQS